MINKIVLHSKRINVDEKSQYADINLSHDNFDEAALTFFLIFKQRD